MNNSGNILQTLSTTDTATGSPVVYGALTWDSTSGTGSGFLWGGRYDGSGRIDRIDPATGKATTVFTAPFQYGESCYAQPSGYTDGLAHDSSDNSLWLSDDASRYIYHVSADGTVLARMAAPANSCNSGIAVDGKSLWLGLQSGPDQAPFSLVRVSKKDPSAILTTYDFGSSVGPEGLAYDNSSFTDGCVLWTNQYGDSLTIKAWKLPSLLCQGQNAKTGNPMDAIGLLTVTDPSTGAKHACTASLINSNNRSVVVTAGHCAASSNNFYTDFAFAPAHTGDIASGISPYGIWTANSSDVVVDSRYLSGDMAYDFAYIIMDKNAAGERIGDVAPSLNIQFNQGRSQPWTAYGYPGTPTLQSCSTDTAGSENASGSSGSDPQDMTMDCDVLTEGSSGGPWIAQSSNAIGGVNSQFVPQQVLPPVFDAYEKGTYLGCQAQVEYESARHMQPGSGPKAFAPSC